MGGAAERAYLEKTYEAGVLSVPPFLNTCTDIQKVEPAVIHMQVTKSEKEQLQAVRDVAYKAAAHRPVLVIAKTGEDAGRIYKGLRKSVNDERVQLLVEVIDGVKQNMKWESIIDAATQPFTEGGCNAWHITVTDYFGGRGHDYKVTDESANDAGGMLVLITHIPDSSREWVQWKGRTARQDRNGELALVLNSSENFMMQQGDILLNFKKGDLNNDELVSALLERRSTAMEKKLDGYAEDQRVSMLTNVLCDRFYAKYGSATGGGWPSTPEMVKLRDFLESKNRTVKSTLEMAEQLGLRADFPYVDVRTTQEYRPIS